MNLVSLGKRIDAIEKQLMSRMVAPVLILRAKDYPGWIVPADVTKRAQHVIVIKVRERRVGEEIEHSFIQ
jgi:hypothetical protein